MPCWCQALSRGEYDLLTDEQVGQLDQACMATTARRMKLRKGHSSQKRLTVSHISERSKKIPRNSRTVIRDVHSPASDESPAHYTEESEIESQEQRPLFPDTSTSLQGEDRITESECEFPDQRSTSSESSASLQDCESSNQHGVSSSSTSAVTPTSNGTTDQQSKKWEKVLRTVHEAVEILEANKGSWEHRPSTFTEIGRMSLQDILRGQQSRSSSYGSIDGVAEAFRSAHGSGIHCQMFKILLAYTAKRKYTSRRIGGGNCFMKLKKYGRAAELVVQASGYESILLLMPQTSWSAMSNDDIRARVGALKQCPTTATYVKNFQPLAKVLVHHLESVIQLHDPAATRSASYGPAPLFDTSSDPSAVPDNPSGITDEQPNDSEPHMVSDGPIPDAATVGTYQMNPTLAPDPLYDDYGHYINPFTVRFDQCM